MFHRQLIHFGIGVYRKITKIKCTAIGDGVINCVEFCRVLIFTCVNGSKS